MTEIYFDFLRLPKRGAKLFYRVVSVSPEFDPPTKPVTVKWGELVYRERWHGPLSADSPFWGKVEKSPPPEHAELRTGREILVVSDRPFGIILLSSPHDSRPSHHGFVFEPLPVPAREVGIHLRAGELRRLKGRIGKEAYAEMLAVKLRET
jgi:hypothetical protein